MSVRARRFGLALAALLFAMPGTASDVATSGAALEAPRDLLWKGDLGAAERGFARVLAADDRNVDALLGLAQARRWSGRPLAARAAAARAVEIAPDRGDAREELAWAWADAGRGASARAVFERTSAVPSPGLRARLAELSGLAIAVTSTAYEDSNGAMRLVSRASTTIPVRDSALTLVAGGSRVSVGTEALERAVAGIALRVPVARAELMGAWAVHGGRDEAPLYEGQLGIRVALSDSARTGIAARRRPFVEVESLATDDAAYHAAGPFGALDPAYVARRGVDELRLSFQGAPFRGTYVYADARGFTLTDANRGWSTAAGAGLHVLAALGLRPPVDLVLRWDAYFTGVAERRPGYFSPSFLDGQSPGVELRARLGRALELAGEGGFTTSLVSDPGPGGWFAGGGITLRIESLTISGRGQIRNDPWYQSRRAILAVEGRL